MVSFRKTSGMVSSLRESAQLAIPICASDVVKKDLEGIKINMDSWEQVPDNQVNWRATVHKHIIGSESRWHGLRLKCVACTPNALPSKKEQPSQTLTTVACAADNASPE